MTTLIIPLSFSILVFGHFVWSFYAEARRQRIFSWPRVAVIFGADRPIRLKPHFARPKKKWLTQLLEPYHFYAYGELFTGNQLLPREQHVGEFDRDRVEYKLNLGKHPLKAWYNPKKPEENMLLVPRRRLSWWGVIAYLFFGLVLPFLFVYLQPMGPIITFFEWQIAN